MQKTNKDIYIEYLIKYAKKLKKDDLFPFIEKIGGAEDGKIISKNTMTYMITYLSKYLQSLSDDQLLTYIDKCNIDIGNKEQCSACFELMGKDYDPLICGHWIHKTCLYKTRKTICPICRADISEGLSFYQLQKFKEIKQFKKLQDDLTASGLPDLFKLNIFKN